MDPAHLKLDELNYELYIRFVDGLVDKTSKFKSLKSLIQKENQGEVTFPSGNRGIPARQEIEACYGKIVELKGVTQPALQSGDQKMLEYSRSRFTHLHDRSNRISAQSVEEQNQVDGIKQAIKKWLGAIERNLEGGMVRFNSKGSVFSGVVDFSIGNGEGKSPGLTSPKENNDLGLGAIGPAGNQSMESSFNASRMNNAEDTPNNFGGRPNDEGQKVVKKASAFLPGLQTGGNTQASGLQRNPLSGKEYGEVLDSLAFFDPFNEMEERSKGLPQSIKSRSVGNQTHSHGNEKSLIYDFTNDLWKNQNQNSRKNLFGGNNFQSIKEGSHESLFDNGIGNNTHSDSRPRGEPHQRTHQSQNTSLRYERKAETQGGYFDRNQGRRRDIPPPYPPKTGVSFQAEQYYDRSNRSFDDDRYRLENAGNNDRLLEPVQLPNRNQNRKDFRLNRKYKPVHSWSIKFNGENGISLMDFIDQVEMLQIAEGIDSEELLSSIIHLLGGRAFEWYRSVFREIRSWNEFKRLIKEEFIPENYERMLWWDIETRVQGKNEPYGSYLCAMKRLFQCLSTQLSEEYKLYVVRKGLNGLYALNLATSDVRSLDELSRLCKRIDSTRLMLHRQKCINVSRDSLLEPDVSFTSKPVQRHVNAFEEEAEEEVKEINAFSKKSHGPQPSNKEKAQNEGKSTRTKEPTVTCWNCGASGHSFTECRKPRQGIFCYRCGEKDLIAPKCSRCNSGTSANSREKDFKTKSPENEQEILEPSQLM